MALVDLIGTSVLRSSVLVLSCVITAKVFMKTLIVSFIISFVFSRQVEVLNDLESNSEYDEVKIGESN